MFDPKTPQGLLRSNGISVEDDEYMTIINRGIFSEGAERAYTPITGLIRGSDGGYDRFREVLYETGYEDDTVRSLLGEVGFVKTYVVAALDLEYPVTDVEDVPRLFYVTEKE